MGPWTNHRGLQVNDGDIGETERRVWIPEPADVPVEEPSPEAVPVTEPALVPA